MKVLVCGSRHFEDYQFVEEVLNKLCISELIHGGAYGADNLAGCYAQSNEIPMKVFRADWGTYGKKAGPIRNIKMLEEGKPDLVIAFLAADSRGTKHMIEIAQKAGVPVEIINV